MPDATVVSTTESKAEVLELDCANPFKSTKALPRTPAAAILMQDTVTSPSPMIISKSVQVFTEALTMEIPSPPAETSCPEEQIFIADALLEPRRKSIEILRRESGQSRRLPRGSLSGPVYNVKKITNNKFHPIILHFIVKILKNSEFL